MERTTSGTRNPPEIRDVQVVLENVQDALRGLQFGEVTIVVQDGVAVQVKRTERRLLRRAERRG